MAEKLVIEDGKIVGNYVIRPILARGERHDGQYPIEIIPLEEVDGCVPIQLSQSQADDCIIAILGIAKTKEELPNKLYECTLKAAAKYAEHLHCPIEDQTRRAKESKLEEVAQTQP